MAITRVGPQSVTPIPRGNGFSLSGLFSDPKAQMGMLTLGNMLMQANPRTQRMGTSMMQGGSALIQLQLDEEEKAAAAKAKKEENLKETLFGLAESGNYDPDLFKLALEEAGVDPSNPYAKTWLKKATSENEEERTLAIGLAGTAGLKMLEGGMTVKQIQEFMQDSAKMEQDERHHQDSLAVRQGQLDVSRGNLDLDREEAERDRAVSDMLMRELAAMGATGAPPASTVSAGLEGEQVVPVGQGQVSPTQAAPSQAPAAPSAGGMTGLPMVDSTLRIGSIMAAMGDTGRANYFASMARLLADKSPEGRQANIEEKVNERVASERARVLTTDELLKIVGPDGKSFPPGTTVGDLEHMGEAIRPRPTQAIPADRQDKLLGGINNLMFVEKQLDAVRKGVKTGLSPTAGPLSWIKSYLGFENEAQFRAAQEQAATAAQALITGIPSNFDAQRFERLIIGFLDHKNMIKQKAMWQVNLTKQMLRTTLAYYKGSNYILPDELINSAKKLGVDVNSVTSFTKEDQKLMEMGDKMEKQISLGEEKDSSSRAEEAEKYLRKYGIQ